MEDVIYIVLIGIPAFSNVSLSFQLLTKATVSFMNYFIFPDSVFAASIYQKILEFVFSKHIKNNA